MNKIFKNIVCIGDSTTSQEWCRPNWIDWLNFVFKQGSTSPNYNVINSGIDGANINIYLENFEELIGRYSPEIVIMSLGFNHLEGTTNFSELTEELIQKIKNIGSEVILWSTYETINPKISKTLEEVSIQYSNISKKLDCKFVDIYSEFKKFDLSKIFTNTYKWENEEWNMKPGDTDFLHCNAIGNQIIAEKILKDCFNLDLSLTEEFEGMGNMNKVNLNDFLI